MIKIAEHTLKIKSMWFAIYVLIVIVGIIPMMSMRFGVLGYYESREVSTKTIELTSQGKLLVTQIANTGYLDNTMSQEVNAQLNMMANIYDGRIMVVDKTYTIVKDTYDLSEGKIITSKEVVDTFKGNVNSFYDAEYGYLGVTVPIVDQYEKEVVGALVITISADSINADVEFYTQQADMVALIFAILLVFLASPITEMLVKPLRKLSSELDERRQGLTDEDIAVNDVWETREISQKINQLLNNMKVLDESRQEFVSNVSHELKTPMTSVKVLADSLLSMEDVPAELYREFMVDITAEIDRESKIIEDLLSLVKMDKAAAKLEVAAINVNELLEVILKRLKPIADKQEVELVLESFRPVTAELDETKISLAFTNLVENAIKYNRQGGWVRVTLNSDHQYFYVTVEDSGIGIPEESLEHIFERFYRVDKSHSREIGGTGLGLAITRNSILMHRGAVKVHSEMEKGTTFSVRIPLNYIQ